MKFAWDNIAVKHIEVELKVGTDIGYALREATQLALQEMVTVQFTIHPSKPADERVFELNPMRIIQLLDMDQKKRVTIDTYQD